jgi:hypothetical protein
VNVALVGLGLAIGVAGMISIIKPEVPIIIRNEWARLLSRPFLHGRLLGGGAVKDDSLQRFFSRAGGLLMIFVGTVMVMVGIVGHD